MRQLSALDAQFLHVESATTLGHVGSLLVLDPAGLDAPWGLDRVRAVLEPRLRSTPPMSQRLAEVPFGLGRPYWVDDPDFDIEFHLRELALPAPGNREQLGEQVARIHARPLDRTRPLWEAYVITGLEDGRAAFYTKVHHAAIDGVSGAEILESVLDLTPEPTDGTEEEPVDRAMPPSAVELLGHALVSLVRSPRQVAQVVPQSVRYIDRVPGAANVPGLRTLAEAAELVGRALGQDRQVRPRADLQPPHTPLNGPITAHRRFGFGSVPLSQVKRARSALQMTVNDVVMAMTAGALRRWLLDHDALPRVPLVAAVPVSVRAEDARGRLGNQVSVMLAELPTHIADPVQRAEATRLAMHEAKQDFETVPASLLQDLSTAVPTALSGLAARTLFRLVAAGSKVPFNLFVSNVPGPSVPLYLAGARVEGLFPVSGVSDVTGGLNVTLFSHEGELHFGLIACREMVPDVWHLVGYLGESLEELVAAVEG